jgi:hypothetical protein
MRIKSSSTLFLVVLNRVYATFTKKKFPLFMKLKKKLKLK